MTREECAAELYELIVNKGRWNGNPPKGGIMGTTFDELPVFAQALWLMKADEFAEQNKFKFLEF